MDRSLVPARLLPSLALLGLVTAFLVASVGAAEAQSTHQVTTTEDLDPADADCEDPEPEDCSLRAAVAAADHGDIIEIPAGRYELEDTIEDVPGLTLRGAGSGLDEASATVITATGGGFSGGRLLDATDGSQAGEELVLEHLTLAETEGYHSGLGLRASGLVTLTLTDVHVHGNEAVDGAVGGALRVWDTEVVSITDSTFTANLTEADGGAIHIEDVGEVVISGSLFDGNESTGNSGGAVYVDGEVFEVVVVDSVFEGNVASSSGGAVAITSEQGLGSAMRVEVVGNDFLANRSDDSHGGALAIDDFGRDAGSDVVLDLEDNRFEGNDADGHGGGAYLYRIGRGASGVVTSTVAGNTFADNEAGDGGGGLHHRDLARGADGDVTAWFVDNVAEDNVAGGRGGGIFVDELGRDAAGSAAIEFRENLLKRNASREEGGGAHTGRLARFVGGDVDIVVADNEATANTSESDGGGWSLRRPAYGAEGDVTAEVTGNHFSDNKAYFGGGGGLSVDRLGRDSLGDRITLRIESNRFEENEADEGGAMYVRRTAYGFNEDHYDGDVVVELTGNTFVDNEAIDGHGGAVYFDRLPEEITGNIDVTLEANRFVGNTASGNGGAVLFEQLGAVVGGDLTVVLAANTFLENRAGGTAGSLGLDGSGSSIDGDVEVSIVGTTFASNVAEGGDGGAVWLGGLWGFEMTVTRSAFVGNDATGRGGALYTPSSVELTDTTFVANTATDGGSVYHVDGAVARGDHLTIVDHDEPFMGHLTAEHSNAAFHDVTGCSFYGEIRDSVFTDTVDCEGRRDIDELNDITVVDDLEVADVFSPWYLVPEEGSPLIGAGDAECAGTDQRGMPRPDEDCSVGAVEPTDGIVCPDEPLPRGEQITCELDTGLADRSLQVTVQVNPTLVDGTIALDGDGLGEVSFTIPEDAEGEVLTITATSGADQWFDAEATFGIAPISEDPDDVDGPDESDETEDVTQIDDDADDEDVLPETGLSAAALGSSGLLALLLGAVALYALRREGQRGSPTP